MGQAARVAPPRTARLHVLVILRGELAPSAVAPARRRQNQDHFNGAQGSRIHPDRARKRRDRPLSRGPGRRVYGVDLHAVDNALVNVAGILEQSASGAQSDWHSSEAPTLLIDPTAPTAHVEISDTDGDPSHLDDDSEGQVTTSSFTLAGVTFPAGTKLVDEYEISLTDGTQTYRLVAIGVRIYTAPYPCSDQVIGYTFEGAMPPAGVTLSYVAGSWQDDAERVPCFTPGARIDTEQGPLPVETLRPGARLRAPEGALHRLPWVGRHRVVAARLVATPAQRLAGIRAGALGPGTPAAGLRLSPQHRVLVRSPLALKLSGSAEGLVAAKHRIGLPGIARDDAPGPVTYCHLACARHVLLRANGALTESFVPGVPALEALSRPGRRTLAKILPDALPPPPARPVLSGRLARRLAAHHGRQALALRPFSLRPAPRPGSCQRPAAPGSPP